MLSRWLQRLQGDNMRETQVFYINPVYTTLSIMLSAQSREEVMQNELERMSEERAVAKGAIELISANDEPSFMMGAD